MELRSYQQAIRMFKKVDAKSKVAASAAYEIGRCWYDEKNTDRSIKKATDAFENVVNKFPKEPEARMALLYIVECYTVLGKWEDAANSCRRIIKLYPESEQAQLAQLSLGHSLYQLRRYDDALKAYQKITSDKTDRYDTLIVVEALMYQGEVLSKQKKYKDAALSYLKVALTYDKQDPVTALTALVRAGSAYEDFGQLNDAKNWYRKAIKDYSSLLFSINSDFRDLDRQVISESLRQKFKNNNIQLSKNANVSIKKNGSRWLITSTGQMYLVKRNEREVNKLNIYGWNRMLKIADERLEQIETELQRGTVKSGLNIPTKGNR